jgi:hypothetical protein
MAKFGLVAQGAIRFLCPGCDQHHVVLVEGGPVADKSARWKWNGSITSPTLDPSVKISHLNEKGERDRVLCHSTITAGKILFHPDSPHHLSGKTVELPDIE